MNVRGLIAGTALWLAFVCALHAARGADYAAPDIGAYVASLTQPDNNASCCGAGDLYWADKTDECGPKDQQPCALVAIITDPRGDKITWGDGTTHWRPVIKIGTRISIPPSKIRKHPIPNPTDHNIVFVAVDGSGWQIVWCWEPLSGI